MLGDLVECQRLCEQLRSGPASPKESAVSARDLVMT